MKTQIKMIAATDALVLVSSTSFAGISPSEVCAKVPNDIPSVPAVKKALSTMGGISTLKGVWKLGGLAGTFKKVIIELRYNGNGFFIQVNEDPIKQVWLCAEPADAETLRIHVLNPGLPENELTLVRNNEVDKSIRLASEGSNWKYMKFNRVDH